MKIKDLDFDFHENLDDKYLENVVGGVLYSGGLSSAAQAELAAQIKQSIDANVAGSIAASLGVKPGVTPSTATTYPTHDLSGTTHMSFNFLPSSH